MAAWLVPDCRRHRRSRVARSIPHRSEKAALTFPTWASRAHCCKWKEASASMQVQRFLWSAIEQRHQRQLASHPSYITPPPPAPRPRISSISNSSSSTLLRTQGRTGRTRLSSAYTLASEPPPPALWAAPAAASPPTRSPEFSMHNNAPAHTSKAGLASSRCTDKSPSVCPDPAAAHCQTWTPP